MGNAGAGTGAGRWPTFQPRNLYETDPVLQAALDGVARGPAEASLVEHGAFW